MTGDVYIYKDGHTEMRQPRAHLGYYVTEVIRVSDYLPTSNPHPADVVSFEERRWYRVATIHDVQVFKEI